jgi:hypothetical protein
MQSAAKVDESVSVGVMKADGRFSGVKLLSCGTWHVVAVAADTNEVYSRGGTEEIGTYTL